MVRQARAPSPLGSAIRDSAWSRRSTADDWVMPDTLAGSQGRCEQMLDRRAGPLVHDLRHPPAVAMGGIALVAEQADPLAGAYQTCELVELLARPGGGEMLFVDAEK